MNNDNPFADLNEDEVYKLYKEARDDLYTDWKIRGKMILQYRATDIAIIVYYERGTIADLLAVTPNELTFDEQVNYVHNDFLQQQKDQA